MAPGRVDDDNRLRGLAPLRLGLRRSIAFALAAAAGGDPQGRRERRSLTSATAPPARQRSYGFLFFFDLPTFLPLFFFLPSYLPTFLPSYVTLLPTFKPSYLPTFLPYTPSYLQTFLPSYLIIY